MAAIQVLDSNTINQIAAGEVIERPSSVVKELLENAIDSKATAITVEIQGGGLQTIRVTDNGSGIVREEIPLAFKRHATSKIRTASDLFQVASLGFRGEALASIASVAKVELITKTSDSISGSRYRIEGGEELGLEEVGAPEGTTFIARDLFYNTPVRRKFLKTPATEGSHVADLVEKIALSHPEISIRFINNNQSRLHTSGNHNLKDIIYAVFGREITANLIEVDAGADPIRVGGFIGKPLIARGNRTYENYFINGRYIKSSIIGKAIEDAYKPFMMQHKYPFTMLQFTIDPSYIDVNVHPAKMEIRFRDGEQIYRTVYHTIAMALANRELIPAVSLENGKNAEKELQIPGLENGVLPELPTGKMEGIQGSRPSLKPVRIREEHPEPFETKRLGASQAEVMSVSEDAPGYGAGNGNGSGRNAAASGAGRFDELFGRTGTTGRVESVSMGKTETGTVVHGNEPVGMQNGEKSIAAASGNQTERTEVQSGQMEDADGVKALTGFQTNHSSTLFASKKVLADEKENDEKENVQVGTTGVLDEAENGSINAESASSEQTISGASSEPASDSAGQIASTASVSTGSIQSAPSEKPRQMDLFEDKLLTKSARANHRLIGQLFDTYWLVEYHDNLYIIDQHAAHEKVLYERTMASLQKREYTSQMIDPPIILSLNSSEQLKLEQYMEHFTSIGFEIEPFGGKEYAVRAVPANLFSVAKRELLMEMIDDLAEGNGSGTPDLINERVATMSCKAAVKGNHTLSFAEADKLIDELLELKNPYACPHGRPTIISMSKYELEKKFKRIV